MLRLSSQRTRDRVSGIEGNEVADGLAKEGASHPFIAREIALGIKSDAFGCQGLFDSSTPHSVEVFSWIKANTSSQFRSFCIEKELLALYKNEVRIITKHCPS